MAHVAALYVYPVKGARGLATGVATLRITGLALGAVADRQWMVVEPDGRFVTQRELPRLATVVPVLAGNALILTAAGRGDLAVALDAPRSEPREVIVWRSRVRAHDEGDAAAAWLSAHVGRAVRLVRFDPTDTRACNPEFAGDSGAHTLFADGYPLLVISEASLADLNARLARNGEGPLPMDRFRPSIVIAGWPEYEEDHLDTVDLGAVQLRMVKPCIRCQVTTIDQASAVAGIEPLPTLAGYRHDARLAGVRFGMNAIVTRGAGATLRVGLPVAGNVRFDGCG